MRKFLLLLLSFILILQQTNANNSIDNIQKKVFKLKSYYYSEDYNTFMDYWYWSAILIWENKILTNAHVILDEDDEILWKYSLCKTYDFKKEPLCFSKLKLLSYDTWLDLALLEILDDTTWLWIPFEVKQKELNIWDTVTAYWFPSNGWNTITFTQWKISWFDAPFYKIDANLDAGSSGWALFDENNNFIGVTSAVSSWYTTLWEVISTSDIKLFLDNIEENKEIKDYYKFSKEKEKKEYENFNNYIDSIHKKLTYDYVDTWFIKIKNLKKYGFRISDISVFDYKLPSESKQYLLKSDSYNTKVAINHFETLWKTNLEEEDYEFIGKFQEKISDDEDKNKNEQDKEEEKKIIKKKIKLKWEEISFRIEINKKNKDIIFYINWENWIDIEIFSNLKYSKEINKSLAMIFSWYEKVQDYENKVEELEYFWIKFKKTSWFEIWKILNTENWMYYFVWFGQSYELKNKEKDYSFFSVIPFYSYLDDESAKKTSLEDLKDSYKKDNYYSLPWVTYEKSEIISNWKNNYIFLLWKNIKKWFFVYSFITFEEVDNEKMYYMINIITTSKNEKIEKDIIELINNVSVNWEEYIKIENKTKVKNIYDAFE